MAQFNYKKITTVPTAKVIYFMFYECNLHMDIKK